MTLTPTLMTLTPTNLRELACLLEDKQPERIALNSLSGEGLEVLAGIFAAGSTPSVGFWRRYGGAR